MFCINYFIITFTSTCIFISGGLSQNDISNRLNSFAINMLSELVNEAGDHLNIAVSPYTVWTLLSVIAEGANNNSLRQLDDVLNLPTDKSKFRNDFNQLTNTLLHNLNGVHLDLSNAIFTTMQQKLHQPFQKIAKTFYGVNVEPTNFQDPSTAAKTINSYINKATRGRTPNFVNADDLYDAAIFLTSVLYFKGIWGSPFNSSWTEPEDFYDETFTQSLGRVAMMHQIGEFPFTRLDDLKAFAVELPYGDGSKMSMIVILPYGKESISNVVNAIQRRSFNSIIDILEEAKIKFAGDEVEVFLPRFEAKSEFILNIILHKMGITDVFHPSRAELLGIFPHLLYISRILHRGEIEVNEEGTVASAASGASLSYKTTIPKFRANKPFLYFIVDKPTKSILFYGRISNPNKLR